MSVAEMKEVINKKMNDLNEAQLKVVLEIIKSVGEPKYSSDSIESIFEEAVAKYSYVLQKLAQ